jgi:hypothetical protein
MTGNCQFAIYIFQVDRSIAGAPSTDCHRRKFGGNAYGHNSWTNVSSFYDTVKISGVYIIQSFLQKSSTTLSIQHSIHTNLTQVSNPGLSCSLKLKGSFTSASSKSTNTSHLIICLYTQNIKMQQNSSVIPEYHGMVSHPLEGWYNHETYGCLYWMNGHHASIWWIPHPVASTPTVNIATLKPRNSNMVAQNTGFLFWLEMDLQIMASHHICSWELDLGLQSNYRMQTSYLQNSKTMLQSHTLQSKSSIPSCVLPETTTSLGIPSSSFFFRVGGSQDLSSKCPYTPVIPIAFTAANPQSHGVTSVTTWTDRTNQTGLTGLHNI